MGRVSQRAENLHPKRVAAHTTIQRLPSVPVHDHQSPEGLGDFLVPRTCPSANRVRMSPETKHRVHQNDHR